MQNAPRGALQGGHSAILSTFIKVPFVIKTFVLSIFEWLFYAGFFYGDLVYKFKRIIGKPNFRDQFKKILKCYIKVGYNFDIMRQSAYLMPQSACPVLNPIRGWCLMFICSLAQLEVFFSSDYLGVVSPFLCFIMVC